MIDRSWSSVLHLIMKILGLYFGHDSGAALVEDGKVVAAVNEERISRIKHYGGVPVGAARYCVEVAGGEDKIDAIAWSGIAVDAMAFFRLPPDALIQKSLGMPTKTVKEALIQSLKRLAGKKEWCPKLPLYEGDFRFTQKKPIHYVDHHTTHAAAAYFASGFDDCLTITLDGVGDGTSALVYEVKNGNFTELARYDCSASFGFFYALCTLALGWAAGEGEGKTMGLAPYGDPEAFPDEELTRFLPQIRDGRILKAHDFGDVTAVQIHGAYHWDFRETAEVEELIRKYGKENFAAKAQKLLENEMVDFVRFWLSKTGHRRLAGGGGVFLNVKANQKIIEDGIAVEYYIFPNAGDGGNCVGAAFHVYNLLQGPARGYHLTHVYLGQQYTTEQVKAIMDERNIPYRISSDVAKETAKFLVDGKIVAWFQGRMEFGPRALGSRSILYDPRPAENKDIINARVKFREPFRPFCPSMTREAAAKYLMHSRPEHFMIVANSVPEPLQKDLRAVVHVDGTCRPQIIDERHHPLYYRMVEEFGKLTGVPVVLNTSMNIKGEPVVCSPRDALKCLMDTGIDVLVCENVIVDKAEFKR
jgi:carbamoyltransferase